MSSEWTEALKQCCNPRIKSSQQRCISTLPKTTSTTTSVTKKTYTSVIEKNC